MNTTAATSDLLDALSYRLQHVLLVTPEQKVGLVLVIIFLVMVYVMIASTPPLPPKRKK